MSDKLPSQEASITGQSIFIVSLAGAITMAVVMGIGRFFFTPVLPAMMADLSMGPAEAGFIASANYAGYLLGAIVAAFGWAEGVERKVAMAGFVATILLLALMAVTTDLTIFVFIRFLAGFVSALVMIFTSSLVLSVGVTQGKPGVQAVHFGGVGLGIAVSAAMFATVVFFDGGWRISWIVAAGIGSLGLVFAWRYLPRSVSRTGPVEKEPPLVWNKPLVALTLSYGLFGFGYIVTATFLVAIVRDSGGSSSFEAIVWLATGLAAAPSVAYWAPVARRVGAMSAYMIGCLVEAFGVAASVLLPLPFGPLIGGILLGGTFVMITAYGLQAGRVFAHRSPRRLFAMMTAAFGTGQIIGPVVAGVLADLSGNYVLASLSAVTALLVSSGLAWSIRHSR